MFTVIQESTNAERPENRGPFDNAHEASEWLHKSARRHLTFLKDFPGTDWVLDPATQENGYAELWEKNSGTLVRFWVVELETA